MRRRALRGEDVPHQRAAGDRSGSPARRSRSCASRPSGRGNGAVAMRVGRGCQATSGDGAVSRPGCRDGAEPVGRLLASPWPVGSPGDGASSAQGSRSCGARRSCGRHRTRRAEAVGEPRMLRRGRAGGRRRRPRGRVHPVRPILRSAGQPRVRQDLGRCCGRGVGALRKGRARGPHGRVGPGGRWPRARVRLPPKARRPWPRRASGGREGSGAPLRSRRGGREEGHDFARTVSKERLVGVLRERRAATIDTRLYTVRTLPLTALSEPSRGAERVRATIRKGTGSDARGSASPRNAATVRSSARRLVHGRRHVIAPRASGRLGRRRSAHRVRRRLGPRAEAQRPVGSPHERMRGPTAAQRPGRPEERSPGPVAGRRSST